MSFNSKYSGQQVENLLDQVANGNTGGGGGGGITTELDPIFSASPAAKITDENITSWNNKVDKVDGKQLSTEDFTTLLKQKLDGLSNYDDTEIQEAVSELRTDLDMLVSGDTTTAIKTFNEVIAFLDGIQDTQDLSSIIASIEQQIAAKQEKLVSGTNIKTINGESILGSGDITISSGGSSSGDESSNARKEIVYKGGLSDYTITSMRPNVVYWLDGVENVTIDSFEEPLQGVDSYDIFTVVMLLESLGNNDVSLTLPDNVLWANGQIPDLTMGEFELSISRISDGDFTKYSAVLTQFKPI